MKINTKKLLIIIIVLCICGLLGGTYAYAKWRTSEVQKTEVTFTLEKDFTCAADGGGDITSADVMLAPATCTNEKHAIKRELIAKPTLYGSMNVYMDLWLEIDSLDSELAASSNFKYVLSTNANSCENGVITSGTFSELTEGDTIPLLTQKEYMETQNDKYYLFVWLDKEETSTTTMNRNFSLSLNGECTTVGTESGNSTTVYQEEILNGVGPELATGMIPVTILNNGTVTTVSPLDSSWYSYENKQWANAVLVTNSSRSSYYESDGVTIKANQTILEENILAYYVWIPKYSYKMNDTEQSISISFNSTPEGYIEHPAFNFDGDINGLWVGKFETGHLTLSSSATANNLECTDENCANSDGLIIKPNVESLRRNKVSNFFYASRSMKKNGNPFGLESSNVDTHMMKNSEWGAVAYLSHSQYGINTEIRINNNSEYTTGCGASTVNGSNSVSCEITYGGVSDGIYPQSTTGNITGIFDMSGGSYEYVMGYYSGANSNYVTNPDTYFGYTSSINYAGFTSKPASKYWDEYTTTTSTTACNNGICYGHALSETTSWYLDYAYFVIESGPWFIRGGYYDDVEGAGAFCFDSYYGSAYSDFGFRSVVIKEA